MSGRIKRASVALTLGAIAGTTMIPSAFAAVGGGGTGGGAGGGGGGAADYFKVYTYDDLNDNTPQQGWSQASIDYFYKNMIVPDLMANGGLGGNLSDQDEINAACRPALADAQARGEAAANAAGIDPATIQSRVVQVAFSADHYNGSPRWSVWGSTLDFFVSEYDRFWPSSNVSGALQNYPASLKQQVHDEAIYQANQVGNNLRVVCVALNNLETKPLTTPTYKVEITTDKRSTYTTPGGTTPVDDTIHVKVTSSDGSPVPDQILKGKINLNWAGVNVGTDANARQVNSVRSKDITLHSVNGDIVSPSFSPSDFGWTAWPGGWMWFTVNIPKQGDMEAYVLTPHADPRESWQAPVPKPEKQIFAAGSTTPMTPTDAMAAGMMYNAEVTGNANGYREVQFTDTINTDKVFIGATDKDILSAVKLYATDSTGKYVDLSASPWTTFKIDRSVAGKVIVTAQYVPVATTSNLAEANKYTMSDFKMVVPTYVLPTGTDYTVPDDSKVCYSNFTRCLTGDSRIARKISPMPDKVWVLDEAGALVAADPTRTNTVSADNKVFLPGESVSAVVNGKIPAHLTEDFKQYSITDDWTKSAQYVDFTDATKAKVFLDGKDVTDQFTITNDGTKTIAVAKPEFLANTGGLDKDAVVKLVINGAFKTDYDTNGKTVKLLNDGAESWNNEVKETNEPAVFTWTPDPHKDVVGTLDQGGDESSINGMTAFPGQNIGYKVDVDLRTPADMARGVQTLAVEDDYDPNFTPNKKSLVIYDSRSGTPKVIGATNYTVNWNDAAHQFVVTFNQDWVKANVTPESGSGWLTMRIDGQIDPKIADGTTIKNQAFQIINGVKSATEVPETTIPKVEPHKEDLNTDLQNIDGKTVVQGDHIVYRLTMDGGPARSELAYDVHKLGMKDDYDEGYLDLTADGVKVLNKDTGEDVTDKFNIQVKDGVAWVFAKQVDSTNKATGEKVPGDPQPTDLAAYAVAAINGQTTPIIDQSLLGHDYYVMLDTTVKKETDGYVIKNQAVQNIENVWRETEIVSNPLKDINPSKDVVIKVGDKSINGTEVAMDSSFNYQLNTSVLPADRAYATKSWSITDTFDAKHDSYTQQWAVTTDVDLYDGDKLIAKKGDIIADSSGKVLDGYKAFFTTEWDSKAAKFTISATQAYLDVINTHLDKPVSWSAYTQMIRIAPGDAIKNVHTESVNGTPRESNEVVTKTPEKLGLDVEKFTLAEGPTTGDRDAAKDALALKQIDLENGVKIGVKLTNTSNVTLKDVKMTDKTLKGTGNISDLTCKVPLTANGAQALGGTAKAGDLSTVYGNEIGTLKAGQSIDCEGTLMGETPGLHTNKVTATGTSIFTGKTVTDNDDWNSTTPDNPKIDVEKYVSSEGLSTGDRDSAKEALNLANATDGTKIDFLVKNLGDVNLTNVVLKDQTVAGTGTVTGISCQAPVDSDATKAASTPTVLKSGERVATTQTGVGGTASATPTTTATTTPTTGTATAAPTGTATAAPTTGASTAPTSGTTAAANAVTIPVTRDANGVITADAKAIMAALSAQAGAAGLDATTLKASFQDASGQYVDGMSAFLASFGKVSYDSATGQVTVTPTDPTVTTIPAVTAKLTDAAGKTLDLVVQAAAATTGTATGTATTAPSATPTTGTATGTATSTTAPTSGTTATPTTGTATGTAGTTGTAAPSASSTASATKTQAPAPSSDPAKIGLLRVGQSVTCSGTLSGVKPGTSHEDKATVTGMGTGQSKKQVSDTDLLFAKVPATPVPPRDVTPAQPQPKDAPRGASTGGDMPIEQSLLLGLLSALGLGSVVTASRARRQGAKR